MASGRTRPPRSSFAAVGAFQGSVTSIRGTELLNRFHPTFRRLYLLFWPHFVPGLFDDSPHSIYPFTILALQAGAPNLHLRPLMDTDFAISCPLVRPQVPLSGFCTSGRGFAPRFLQTPPRDDALAFLLILHLHQVG